MSAVAWEVALRACGQDAPPGCTDVAGEASPVGLIAVLVVVAMLIVVGVLAARARRR